MQSEIIIIVYQVLGYKTFVTNQQIVEIYQTLSSKNFYFVNIVVPSFSNMTFICFTATHLLPWTDQTENQPSTSDDSNCSGGLNSIAKFNII